MDGPATATAIAPTLEPAGDDEPEIEPDAIRARAACASACASSALRYRCAGDRVAAGDVEFGVRATGSGGERGVCAGDIIRDTADVGSCDWGERIMDTTADWTCGDVRYGMGVAVPRISVDAMSIDVGLSV